MKSLFRSKLVKLPTFLFSLFASASAFAEIEPRLIEIQSGQKVWMTEAEISALSDRTHREGRCGGYMDVTDYPELPELFLQPIAGLGNLEIQENRAVEAALSVLSADRLRADVQKLSSFHNRYYQSEQGEAAALWIRDQFQALGRHRNDIQVELYRHSGWRQPSVIATIRGAGPNAAETVVLGAHLDSIAAMWGFPNPNAKAPGADDDASGIATLLETYRSLMETGFRPDRSIAFIGYAAEERGLLGSQEISRAWRQQGKQVRGVLQLDMTMFPGTTRAITFVTDHVNPELTRFSAQLVDTYVKAPWRETRCGYACSDHASWTKLGYAAAFPFEATFDGSNQAIHTDRDLIGLLDMEHGLHFAKLGAAFAIEMANEAP